MKRMTCRLFQTKCNNVVLQNSASVYAWIKCKHEKNWIQTDWQNVNLDFSCGVNFVSNLIATMHILLK